MRIFRHYEDIPGDFRGAAVAIGNFDGVHLGHRALIGEAARLAREAGGPLGVLAFEPHPQEYFRPSPESFRLTPFRAKVRLLTALGVDALFALPFDAHMSRFTAPEFVMEVLVRGLGIGGVVVGHDFRFGKGRAGDAAALAYMGAMEGFAVSIFDTVEAHSDKISSTNIRQALKAAKPELAASLLGHFWAVEARVEHGDKRGRTIGFPTANMRPEHCLLPAFGVYAVRVTILENDRPVSRHDGVANFGIRPMYRSEAPLLESFLFDFDGDLYGKYLSVELVSFIRPEQKFADLDALKAQIGRDAATARTALARLPASPPLDA